MSITILEKDEALARMLLLEAKRQGFAEEGEPSLLLVDLDDFDVPSDNTPLTLGFSRNANSLQTKKKERVHALLSLPFSVAEFTKTISRVRTYGKSASLSVRDGHVVLNGKTLSLSKGERAVFQLLLENRHRAVSEQELAAALGENAENSNAVAVYLYRLRRKLCADGQKRIRTLRGKGYQWIEKVE